MLSLQQEPSDATVGARSAAQRSDATRPHRSGPLAGPECRSRACKAKSERRFEAALEECFEGVEVDNDRAAGHMSWAFSTRTWASLQQATRPIRRRSASSREHRPAKRTWPLLYDDLIGQAQAPGAAARPERQSNWPPSRRSNPSHRCRPKRSAERRRARPARARRLARRPPTPRFKAPWAWPAIGGLAQGGGTRPPDRSALGAAKSAAPVPPGGLLQGHGAPPDRAAGSTALLELRPENEGVPRSCERRFCSQRPVGPEP